MTSRSIYLTTNKCDSSENLPWLVRLPQLETLQPSHSTKTIFVQRNLLFFLELHLFITFDSETFRLQRLMCNTFLRTQVSHTYFTVP